MYLVMDRWSFNVLILQRTAKKCIKIQNALAEPFFWSLNLLFVDVLITVMYGGPEGSHMQIKNVAAN